MLSLSLTSITYICEKSSRHLRIFLQYGLENDEVNTSMQNYFFFYAC